MYIFHLYGLMHGEQRYAYLESFSTEIEAQNRVHALQAYKDIIIIGRRKCLSILPTAFLDQQTRIILTDIGACGAL